MPDGPLRILITGGCGYLGSQLLADFAQHAPPSLQQLRILDNLQSGDVRALQHLSNSVAFQFIEGDILNPAVLRLATEGVDAVIHLAAIVRTPLSFDRPSWLQQVNQWGTGNVAEACLAAKVKHLVFLSSTAVYGPGGPFTESSECRPQGPYAESKFAAERMLQTVHSRGVNVSVVRLGTLYGLAPVTRFASVANRFAYLAAVQRPLTVFGDGQQRRPLIHVRDASRFIRELLVNPNLAHRGTMNLVSSSPSINELAEIISQLQPQVTVRYADQDIRTHYSFDVSANLAYQAGWMPRESLEDGLGELLGSFARFDRVMPEHGANINES